MRNRPLKIMVFCLILVMILGVSGLAFAATGNLGDDVINALKSKEKGLIDEGAMTNIQKLSRDVFNVIRYFVIFILVVKLFSFISQFSNAGEDIHLRATLKKKLSWTAGGLVIALNFWNFYGFISKIVINL
ncbi:hypothetical protein NE686_17175 [Tissierella carlieri]|uniref:Uncharacterized protein n=1 Tax=Tissierella carlieri TaxID=689904 RepID=A0ABT1SEB6_9FIRM|nr:hypothetical protein [Tissierella carlieri]MCQ4924837.1 hypothetical protein [Tissierella carlieri]